MNPPVLPKAFEFTENVVDLFFGHLIEPIEYKDPSPVGGCGTEKDADIVFKSRAAVWCYFCSLEK
jgi:hypothetical protein